MSKAKQYKRERRPVSQQPKSTLAETKYVMHWESIALLRANLRIKRANPNAYDVQFEGVCPNCNLPNYYSFRVPLARHVFFSCLCGYQTFGQRKGRG